MSEKSKTPETDAEVESNASPWSTDYIKADFARSLELRVAALTQANAELTKQVAEKERDLASLRDREYSEGYSVEWRDGRHWVYPATGGGFVWNGDPIFNAIHCAKLTTQLADAKKDAEWQPIADLPEYVDGQELQRLLVYSIDFGVTIGNAIRWPDGTFTHRVEGQCGDWPITHWRPLPPTPNTTSAQKGK